MNRTDDLILLIAQALATAHGILLVVTGNGPNRRSQAITVLTAAKRSMIPDYPDALNLNIRPVPGTDDQIALVRLSDPLGEV